MNNKKIIVVGAGPAGIMASITAAEYSNDITIIEKNANIGQKLRITGGGRCNVTNNSSPDEIMKKVMTNSKFLYKSLHTYTSQQVIKLIEDHGCPLKVETGNKVFPASDKSSDIIEVFQKLLINRAVKIYYHCEMKDILVKENKVIGIKTKDNQDFTCDAIILATGGVSYQHTGSTGEALQICERLGHSIVSLKPSLISMVIKEKWLTELTGISLKDIVLKTKIGNKAFSFNGDLLFTHYGISGPTVFELSAYLNKILLPKEGHRVFIDFLPKVPQEELKEILITSQKNNKQIVSVLTDYLPKKLSVALLNDINIASDINLSQLNKKDRNRMIDTLKHFPITVEALRSVKDAIVTSGGINVKEVNPSTMESKLVKGLYFAGELLDVDALTGGYNLQIAFSTGYIAGVHSSK